MTTPLQPPAIALEKQSLWCDDELWSESRHEKLPVMKKVMEDACVAQLYAPPSSPEKDVDIGAFLEALEKAPELIARESDPLLYLRREVGDVHAACTRLFTYWTQRRNVFGESQAFLPLQYGTSDSPGAIGKKEIDLMQTGFLVALPNDRHGRSVVCIDETRRPKLAGDSDANRVRDRVIFYILSLTLANSLSQTDGVVILTVFKEKTPLNQSSMIFRLLLTEAMPVKLFRMHYCGCVPLAARRVFLKVMVKNTYESHGGRALTETYEVHMGPSAAEVKGQLQEHGIDKKSIPVDIGGCWDYIDWESRIERLKSGDVCGMKVSSEHLLADDCKPPAKVLDLQAKSEQSETFCEKSEVNDIRKKSSELIEKNIPGQDSKDVSEDQVKVAAKLHQTSIPTAVSKTEPLSARLKVPSSFVDESLLRKARRDPEGVSLPAKETITVAEGSQINLKESEELSTSRRGLKRSASARDDDDDHHKAFMKKTPKSAAKLKSGPTAALKALDIPSDLKLEDDTENPYTEETVRKLTAVMAVVPDECFDRGDNEEGNIAFIRKRNALYSKRKYYKRKLQMESLMISRDKLVSANVGLKAEGYRLQTLYDQAKEIAAREDLRTLQSSVNTSRQGNASLLGGPSLDTRSLRGQDKLPPRNFGVVGGSQQVGVDSSESMLQQLIARTPQQPMLPLGAGAGNMFQDRDILQRRLLGLIQPTGGDLAQQLRILERLQSAELERVAALLELDRSTSFGHRGVYRAPSRSIDSSLLTSLLREPRSMEQLAQQFILPGDRSTEPNISSLLLASRASAIREAHGRTSGLSQQELLLRLFQQSESRGSLGQPFF